MRELCVRGVSKEVAGSAVDAYFETVDEAELCRLAYERLSSKQKNERKIMKSLADSGFSYKIIQRVLREKKVSGYAS